MKSTVFLFLEKIFGLWTLQNYYNIFFSLSNGFQKIDIRTMYDKRDRIPLFLLQRKISVLLWENDSKFQNKTQWKSFLFSYLLLILYLMFGFNLLQFGLFFCLVLTNKILQGNFFKHWSWFLCIDLHLD